MKSESNPEHLFDKAILELSKGEMLSAHEALSKARKFYTDEEALEIPPIRLKIEECYLRTLAALGNQLDVVSRIERMLQDGIYSEDLFGLAGRCYKDIFRQSGRVDFLKNAYEKYMSGFDQLGRNSYYLGVNAVSCAAVSGASEFKILANEVMSIASQEPEGSPWKHATIAECQLVFGKLEDAATSYRLGVSFARDDLLARTSMRKQARWLLRHLGHSERTLDECFNIGPLILFGGHLPDQSKRQEPRFPESIIDSVRSSIRRQVSQTGPAVAFSSAAAGSDLLFLECLMELAVPFHLVLPCPEMQFLEISVQPFGSPWDEIYARALRHATSIRYCNRRDKPASAGAWKFASECLAGFASLHAEANALDVELLTVWDGKPGESGGTGNLVSISNKLNMPITRISPLDGDILSAIPPDLACLETVTKDEVLQRGEQVTRSIVFADVKGFSQLSDQQIPDFVSFFWGEVSKVLSQVRYSPLAVNTWGDAMVLVFDEPLSAGDFCLDVMDCVSGTDWTAVGLPGDISFRISCHAGPVFEVLDPLTNKTSFFGLHVNQAARIEPITPPGNIYVSEEFAAQTKLYGKAGFTFEIIGSLELAKAFGRMRIYKLTKNASSK